jgi:hypothetical protein
MSSTHFLKIAPALLSIASLACGNEGPGESSGSAGTTQAGAAGSSGASAGSAGTSGGASGKGGSAGASAGAGAVGGAAAAGGGGGAGAEAGTAGAGGVSGGGAGGVSGGGGTVAGQSGTAGGGTGGGGTVSDAYATDVAIAVHDDVNTILVVTWTQAMAAEQVWLEFTFEEGNVMTSRPKPGAAGPQRDVVLGVPGDMDVTVRVVSQAGGANYVSSDYMGHTDPVPDIMPEPTVLSYDPSLASPDRFMFGALEDSPESVQQSRNNYYSGRFWLYIMDRKGRIVWYYNNPANNASSSFPRVARDGEYIWVDQGRSGNQGVVKMTLDHEYFETFDIPVGDCIDVTEEGTLLYDVDGELFEWTEGEGSRSIWDCRSEIDLSPNCYSNTVNYNPTLDSVLLSFPEPGAVVEIDRQSGEMIGYYGNQTGTWDFAPPLTTPPAEWRFGIQHFANITAAGTLLVSSHLPPHDTFQAPPSPNEHAFVEFTLDRNAQTLTELWRYTEGREWPHAKGMAIRLENGNTLANYGTGGVIREITPAKETAFDVKWDLEGTEDFYNKMVGHNVLVDDLYALNGGPQ